MGSDKTYNKGSIWVYDKLVTNIGNAYNPGTGKFSAPTTGIYQFNWNTLCNPGSMAHAGLFVNGKFTANQVYNNGGGIRLWITAGSSIALSLKKRRWSLHNGCPWRNCSDTTKLLYGFWWRADKLAFCMFNDFKVERYNKLMVMYTVFFVIYWVVKYLRLLKWSFVRCNLSVQKQEANKLWRSHMNINNC